MLGSLVYRLNPVWAQEFFLAARSAVRSRMREGRAFDALAAHLHESQWWSESRLREFQRRELRTVIGSALRDVPYYRERYRRLAGEPDHMDIVKLLERLPVIGKTEVREAGRALISACKRGPLFPGSSSGTTGAPLSLYQDLHAITRENAFIWRQLAWAGMQRGDRRAWIRGDMIVPAGQRQPPFWRMNRAENMLMLSSYHLSERAARSARWLRNCRKANGGRSSGCAIFNGGSCVRSSAPPCGTSRTTASATGVSR